MVLVFDLDDTLYPELTYVHSGFRAVAQFLKREYHVSFKGSLQFMIEEESKNGRGRIFNDTLKKFNLLTRQNINQCIKTYRFHNPSIKLHEDAAVVLKKNRQINKYIVTDGNKFVQCKKAGALKLSKVVKKVFITHRYGISKAKPNPYCFLKICSLENVSPNNLVYVGDNPNKDFVLIKKLGIHTVRIKRGMFKDVELSPEYEADLCVNDLREIDFKRIVK